MRNLIFILLVFSVSSAFADDWCNWGYSGADHISCGGKKYCYGTAVCGSRIYSNVFCNTKFCDDGKTCADDNSQETIDCYNKTVAKKSEPQPKAPKGEFCNWGYSGAKILECEGQRFCYGTAVCGSHVYSNVFCKESNCDTGRACEQDDAPVTVRCYNRLIKPRSPSGGNNFLESIPGNGGIR